MNPQTDISFLNYKVGSTHPFSALLRFSKTLQSFHTPLLHPVIFSPAEGSTTAYTGSSSSSSHPYLVDSLSVAGVDFSIKRISNSINLLQKKLISLLESYLLLDYCSYEAAIASFRSCWQRPVIHQHLTGDGLRTTNTTDQLLFQHCLSSSVHSLWFSNGNLKEQKAKSYLSHCFRFEKLAVALLHLVLGSGPRAADYSHLLIRNTAACVANISFVSPEVLLVALPSQKTSLLRNNLQRIPRFVRVDLVEPLLLYWCLIRPLCAQISIPLQPANTTNYHYQSIPQSNTNSHSMDDKCFCLLFSRIYSICCLPCFHAWPSLCLPTFASCHDMFFSSCTP